MTRAAAAQPIDRLDAIKASPGWAIDRAKPMTARSALLNASEAETDPANPSSAATATTAPAGMLDRTCGSLAFVWDVRTMIT